MADLTSREPCPECGCPGEQYDGHACEDYLRFEFRVTWQRKGQAPKRAHYQTEKGARACAERQRSAEEEMDWLPTPLPPIVAGPFIERREVGAWSERVLVAGFNVEVPA